MTGPHPHKYKLEDAEVYIHLSEESSGAPITHIDVEHPDLNDIIKSSESPFVGGKEGGVFIGLKDQMADRAESFLQERH